MKIDSWEAQIAENKSQFIDISRTLELDSPNAADDVEISRACAGVILPHVVKL
jgi:hypothetical protein